MTAPSTTLSDQHFLEAMTTAAASAGITGAQLVTAITTVPYRDNGNVTTGTAAAADVGGIIDCSNTVGTGLCTITIPSGLAAGPITVRMASTGNVKLQAGGGVTLDLPSGFNTISTRYSTMSALYLAANHYTLAGATS